MSDTSPNMRMYLAIKNLRLSGVSINNNNTFIFGDYHTQSTYISVLGINTKISMNNLNYLDSSLNHFNVKMPVYSGRDGYVPESPFPQFQKNYLERFTIYPYTKSRNESMQLCQTLDKYIKSLSTDLIVFYINSIKSDIDKGLLSYLNKFSSTKLKGVKSGLWVLIVAPEKNGYKNIIEKYESTTDIDFCYLTQSEFIEHSSATSISPELNKDIWNKLFINVPCDNYETYISDYYYNVFINIKTHIENIKDVTDNLLTHLNIDNQPKLLGFSGSLINSNYDYEYLSYPGNPNVDINILLHSFKQIYRLCASSGIDAIAKNIIKLNRNLLNTNVFLRSQTLTIINNFISLYKKIEQTFTALFNWLPLGTKFPDISKIKIFPQASKIYTNSIVNIITNNNDLGDISTVYFGSDIALNVVANNNLIKVITPAVSNNTYLFSLATANNSININYDTRLFIDDSISSKIKTIHPTYGKQSDIIEMYGTGLSTDVMVKFGSDVGNLATYISNEKLSIVVPPFAGKSIVDLNITKSGQPIPCNNKFLYTSDTAGSGSDINSDYIVTVSDTSLSASDINSGYGYAGYIMNIAPIATDLVMSDINIILFSENILTVNSDFTVNDDNSINLVVPPSLFIGPTPVALLSGVSDITLPFIFTYNLDTQPTLSMAFNDKPVQGSILGQSDIITLTCNDIGKTSSIIININSDMCSFNNNTTIVHDIAYNSDNTISFKLPALDPPIVGFVNLTVANNIFSYTAPNVLQYINNGGGITISSVTPNVIPSIGGILINISGTNLRNIRKVIYGLSESTNFTINKSGTMISLIVEGSGSVLYDPINLTVIDNLGNTAQLLNAMKYIPIYIYSVSPKYADKRGEESIVISGFNLSEVTKIIVGETVVNLTNSNKTGSQITINAPISLVSGPVDISITDDTYIHTLPNGFYYTSLPPIALSTVSDITPKTGFRTGNDSLVISGSNFSSDIMSIAIGSNINTNFTISSDSSEIRLITPLSQNTGDNDIILFYKLYSIISPVPFKYTPDIIITSVSNVSDTSAEFIATGSDICVLTGTNLQNVTGLMVITGDEDKAVRNYDYNSDTGKIMFTVPASTNYGIAKLHIFNNLYTYVNSTAFSYIPFYIKKVTARASAAISDITEVYTIARNSSTIPIIVDVVSTLKSGFSIILGTSIFNIQSGTEFPYRFTAPISTTTGSIKLLVINGEYIQEDNSLSYI